MTFKEQILQGIPNQLPPKREIPAGINRAPKRKDILSADEKKLAIRNALRYFPKDWHPILAKEFAQELKNFGRITCIVLSHLMIFMRVLFQNIQ